MRGVGKIQSLKIHSQFLAQARSVIVWVCARSDHLPYVACAHVACIHCLWLLIVSLAGLLISLVGLLRFVESCQPLVAGFSLVSL